eukprot:2372473-Rhodomonas_salina.1
MTCTPGGPEAIITIEDDLHSREKQSVRHSKLSRVVTEAHHADSNEDTVMVVFLRICTPSLAEHVRTLCTQLARQRQPNKGWFPRAGRIWCEGFWKTWTSAEPVAVTGTELLPRTPCSLFSFRNVVSPGNAAKPKCPDCMATSPAVSDVLNSMFMFRNNPAADDQSDSTITKLCFFQTFLSRGETCLHCITPFGVTLLS